MPGTGRPRASIVRDVGVLESDSETEDPYPNHQGRITYTAMMAVRQPRGGHCVIYPQAGDEPTSEHSSMEGSEDDGEDMAWDAEEEAEEG